MTEVNLKVAPKLEPLYKPKPTKVFFGGRGGAKSWGVAQFLVIKALEGKRILCTREVQNSIDESVHKLLSDTIHRMGVSHLFKITTKKITSASGGEMFFMGLERGGRAKIKSTEGIDYCWCEEAENISELSWDFLEPTIRKDGAEIIVTYNPADELDATHQKFVIPYIDKLAANDNYYEDDNIIVCKIGWQDNPWFPDSLNKRRLKMKHENFGKYLHIYEGECNADYADSLIKPEWIDAAIDAHVKLGFKARGVKSMGFDPADEGEDAKATTIRHGVVVVSLDMWLDLDLTDSTNKAYDIAQEEKCTDFVYDGDGLGAGVKSIFKLSDVAERIRLTNYKGSETPDNPDQKYDEDQLNADIFKNKRAQYWWLLRDRFEKTFRAVTKGEYIDPNELISLSSDLKYLNVLKSELKRQQRKRAITNTIVQMQSKTEMKKNGIKSPNLADSLVMAFANPPPLTYNKKRVFAKVRLGTMA